MRISTLATAIGLGLIVVACSEGPLTPSRAPSLAPSFNAARGARVGQIPTFDAAAKGGDPCGMIGSDADGNPIFGELGVVTQIVENNNKVMLICKGTDITNLSGRGQQFDGFDCGIIIPSTGEFVITTDSHETISASGNATLTCTYHKA